MKKEKKVRSEFVPKSFNFENKFKLLENKSDDFDFMLWYMHEQEV